MPFEAFEAIPIHFEVAPVVGAKPGSPDESQEPSRKVQLEWGGECSLKMQQIVEYGVEITKLCPIPNSKRVKKSGSCINDV